MKKTLLTLLMIISISTFAQTSSKQWNNLYNRYDYHDSNQRLIGYESYNNLYKRWEYYDLRQSNNNNGYQVQQPPQYADLNLVDRVLTSLQRKYDNMSDEQKRKYHENYDYNKKKNFVSDITYSYKKDFFDQKDKDEKKYKKIFEKISSKDFQQIGNFQDGWYKCYTLLGNNMADERSVFIQNGKISTYLGRIQTEINIENYTIESDNIYNINLKQDKLTFNSKIIFTEEQKIKDKKIIQSSKLTFYTQANTTDDIILIIKGKNGYDRGQNIKTINYVPSCEYTNDRNIFTFPLLPGNYKYKAFTVTEVWEGEIEIKENDCRIINLTN